MGFFRGAALIVVLAVVCCGTLAAQEKSEVVLTHKYEKSIRGSVDGFPLLILRGTDRERGKAHGFLGAKEIVKTADAMAAAINGAGRATGKPVSWDGAKKFVDRFAFPERFVQELEGMLAGIEEALPRPEDRTLTATGGPVTMADLKVLQCGDVIELMLCSQFSAWGGLTADGSTVIGRNWDYPPFFPSDTYCIFAVEPSEKGLRKTLDALWFGMLGAGFACLNEESVYLSANDGGEEEKNVIKDPCPAALAVRMAAETASAKDPLGAVRENIYQRTALGILYHVVAPPRTPGGAPRAWIFEYAPGAKEPFEERLRRPTDDLPNALLVTNTPMIGRKDSESGCRRYEKLLKVLSSTTKAAPLDLDSVRSLLDSVAVSEPSCTTQYSGIVYPARMETYIAVSPAPGRSATRERYVLVRWADVWALTK